MITRLSAGYTCLQIHQFFFFVFVVTTEPDVKEMILEIESIESLLQELKANNEDEFKITEENAQVILTVNLIFLHVFTCLTIAVFHPDSFVRRTHSFVRRTYSFVRRTYSFVRRT